MKGSRLAILAIACALFLAAAAHAQVSIADVRLQRFLGTAEARAVDYFAFFKDLTAEETKTVEEVRANGEVSRRRRILSDLVVYKSLLDNGSITEYRNVREVDGAPVAGREARALALFAKQVELKSVRDELARVNKEGSRYDLDYTVSGLTLAQGLPLQPWARALFDFTPEGEEAVGGKRALRVAYQQAVPNPRFGIQLSLPSSLKRYPPLYRGRLWLDAETAQVLREEREIVVRPSSGAPVVLQRTEFSYAPSRYGIPLPKRIVFGSYMRFERSGDGAETSSLRYRLTFEYGEFKRFTAESDDGEIARVATDDEAAEAAAEAARAAEAEAAEAARREERERVAEAARAAELERAALPGPEATDRSERPPAAAPAPRAETPSRAEAAPLAAADESLGPEFGPDAPTGPPAPTARPAAPPTLARIDAALQPAGASPRLVGHAPAPRAVAVPAPERPAPPSVAARPPAVRLRAEARPAAASAEAPTFARDDTPPAAVAVPPPARPAPPAISARPPSLRTGETARPAETAAPPIALAAPKPGAKVAVAPAREPEPVVLDPPRPSPIAPPFVRLGFLALPAPHPAIAVAFPAPPIAPRVAPAPPPAPAVAPPRREPERPPERRPDSPPPATEPARPKTIRPPIS